MPTVSEIMNNVMHDMILATSIEDAHEYSVTDSETGERYNYLVRDIKEDKKSGGARNLYKSNGTNSYDPVIGRLLGDKRRWDELAEKNRVTMEKTVGWIEAAMKKPGEKGYKAARDTDIERWENELLKLQEEFVELKANSARLMPTIEDCQYNRLIEEMTRGNMRAMRDKYFEDGDEVFLEKGVTWAMNYDYMNRIKINLSLLRRD